MPTTTDIAVSDLSLDLANYRTVHQRSELAAVKSMESISPDYLWGLMHSILDDGYSRTENIIVLETENKGKKTLVVKEGNRRVGILKIILGHLKYTLTDLPEDIQSKITVLTPHCRKDNAKVSCQVYKASEAEAADKVVARIHGKAEKAGRDKWKAVATARHNRDQNKKPEPALDLLEKYLKHGLNVSDSQREVWAGDYPVTVLAEALERVSTRLGFETKAELVKAYPAKLSSRKKLEAMLFDIGTNELTFTKLRDSTKDFGVVYGFPTPAAPPASPTSGKAQPGGTAGLPPAAPPQQAPTTKPSAKSPTTPPLNEPKSVIAELKNWKIVGKGREKVQTLRNEIILLNIVKTPLAFCFVLRSLFEISAKVYCDDHAAAGLSSKKSDGNDKYLADVLRDITKHMTKNNTDRETKKKLHGAIADLGSHDGFLSVTSMNHLVHHKKFSVATADICEKFHNIFCLLQAMNA
ncbi:MAG: hypothetical protein QM703_13195 [Gemmatales bacterium]